MIGPDPGAKALGRAEEQDIVKEPMRPGPRAGAPEREGPVGAAGALAA